MNVHKNARLTGRGREWLVARVASGQTPQAVSEAVGVCPRTVRKWVKRYEAPSRCRLRALSGRSLETAATFDTREPGALQHQRVDRHQS